MEEIKELLVAEIREEFEQLRDVELGSDVYKSTVDGLAKLVDRQIEIEKMKFEHENEIKRQESDEELKVVQTVIDNRDRMFRNCMAVAGVVVPSIITIWGTVTTLKFEETGTVTTSMGRGFINKLLPR